MIKVKVKLAKWDTLLIVKETCCIKRPLLKAYSSTVLAGSENVSKDFTSTLIKLK